MKTSFWLSGLLLAQTLGLLAYSYLAYQQEGPGLFLIAWHNLLALTWNGQFNLDFACYLLLSSLWIIWRNGLTWRSFTLAVLALILGIVFFAPYLMYLLQREKGELKRLLIGNR